MFLRRLVVRLVVALLVLGVALAPGEAMVAAPAGTLNTAPPRFQNETDVVLVSHRKRARWKKRQHRRYLRRYRAQRLWRHQQRYGQRRTRIIVLERRLPRRIYAEAPPVEEDVAKPRHADKLKKPKRQAKEPRTALAAPRTVESRRERKSREPIGLACDEATSIIEGYGFSDVATEQCRGKSYRFSATRDGHDFTVSLDSGTGELEKVKKHKKPEPQLPAAGP